jgi:16S rRNA (cytosine1402-N4)-methyltransferase
METAENTPHKRRPHYRGTHPHTYAEKYKEQNPEKYPEEIEKVISKGSTPAGMHIPIMVNEILEVLSIRPGESGLDCTLGYGGHTRKMLECLAGTGHLTALDVDSENIVRTEKMLREEGHTKEQLSILHLNFRDVQKAAEQFGPFDFVLADLGVSSMQIDEPERGFSWKREGPLDLRLDPARGETAAERLKTLDRDELTGLLIDNADEPYAEEIAAKVMSALRKKKPVETTTQLADLVREAVTGAMTGCKKEEIEETVRKSCSRTFQALRIDINQEYESLSSLLDALPDVLNPGGRVAILTFHSGEDRIVKKQFKEAFREGRYQRIASDVTRPTGEECHRNPRAKSAKLRWAIR